MVCMNLPAIPRLRLYFSPPPGPRPSLQASILLLLLYIYIHIYIQIMYRYTHIRRPRVDLRLAPVLGLCFFASVDLPAIPYLRV